jgi:glutamate-ammonia-ligase adenylyltransferase
MQDIELLSQAGALIAGAAEHWPAAQLKAAAACGWIDGGGGRAARRAHRLFSRVHQSGRLLTDEALDPETVGAGGRAFL